MTVDQQRLDIAMGMATPFTPAETLRALGRVVALALWLAACTPPYYLWLALRLPSPWQRWFLAGAARIVGVRVKIATGKPRGHKVFYIANHLSWLDILALGGASGAAFVAKAEVAETPVVGWLARCNHTVFIERENRLGIAAQIARLQQALTEDRAIAIFPEGTTTDGRSLLPFKTSMLRALEPPPPGVMVQPVLLDYGPVGEEVGWIGEESGLNNARRVLGRRGSFPLRLHFLEPFDPRDCPDRKAIAAESRRRIETALTRILQQPLRTFALPVPQVRYTPPKPAGQEAELKL